MFCRKCGVKIEDDSVFCYKCGERVVLVDDAPESEVKKEAPPVPAASVNTSAEPVPAASVNTSAEPVPAAPVNTAAEPVRTASENTAREPAQTVYIDIVDSIMSKPASGTEPTVAVSDPVPCMDTPSPVSDYINADPYATQARWSAPVIDKPMKWYKFLVYFALWAGAIVNFSSAVYGILGIPEGKDEQVFYSYVYGYETFKCVTGIFLLGFVAFQIYTCIQLLGYRKKAPFLINAVYFSILAYELISVIIISLMVNASAVKLVGTIIGLFIVYVPVCALNAVYFYKRKHLFVY